MSVKRPQQDTQALLDLQSLVCTMLGQGDMAWKGSVSTADDLAGISGKDGDLIYVQDTGKVYGYTSDGWEEKKVPSEGVVHISEVETLPEEGTLGQMVYIENDGLYIWLGSRKSFTFQEE